MKPQNIREILEDVAQTLLDYQQEEREDILMEELDRLCIYTHDCWEVINEERPSDFMMEQIGENASNPYQLAWAILYDKFMEHYSTLIY